MKKVYFNRLITPSLLLLSTFPYIQYIKYFSMTLPNTTLFTRNVCPLFLVYQLPSHSLHLSLLLRQTFSSYLFIYCCEKISRKRSLWEEHSSLNSERIQTINMGKAWQSEHETNWLHCLYSHGDEVMSR